MLDHVLWSIVAVIYGAYAIALVTYTVNRNTKWNENPTTNSEIMRICILTPVFVVGWLFWLVSSTLGSVFRFWLAVERMYGNYRASVCLSGARRPTVDHIVLVAVGLSCAAVVLWQSVAVMANVFVEICVALFEVLFHALEPLLRFIVLVVKAVQKNPFIRAADNLLSSPIPPPPATPTMGPVFELFIIGVICYVAWRVKQLLERSGTSIADLYEQWVVSTRAAVTGTPAYRSFDDVTAELRRLGITESVRMGVGIDFTLSNTENGRRTFGGRSLHDNPVGADAPRNPYVRALDVVGRTLLPLDTDKQVPLFVFGDSTTRATSVRTLGDVDCRGGPAAMIAAYRSAVATATLDGPTSFAPLIDQFAALARETNAFHVLIILCDGQVQLECEPATVRAIRDAARTAQLAIIAIGVGDGPWETMKKFDKDIHTDTLDNFHFVAFDETLAEAPRGVDPELYFAMNAFAELPKQYVDICARQRVRTASAVASTMGELIRPSTAMYTRSRRG